MGDEYTHEQWAHDLDSVTDMQVLAATMYATLKGLQDATGIFSEADYNVMQGRLLKIMMPPDTEAGE